MSASDYAFLAEQYPEFQLRARSDRELEDLLDAWFARLESGEGEAQR
jgi:hypothetical protein